MRRLCFLICLALASACGAVGQAQASPLMLSIWGYADNVPVDYVTDVSNGFSGATIPLSSVPLWAGTGPGPQGGETSMNSSISLGATLFNSTQNLASLGLNGQISGVVTYPNVYSLDPIEGAVKGSAMPGPVTLEPGVDPSTIPAWFSSLGAWVSGDVTGGAYAYLPISLGISPDATPASQIQPAPVPEPASLIIFLASVAAGIGLRRHRHA